MIAGRLEDASPQTSLMCLYILPLLLPIVEPIYIQYYDVRWWEDQVRIAVERGILYVYSAPKAGYPPIPIVLPIAPRPPFAAAPQQLIEKVLLFHAGRASRELSLWVLPLAVLGFMVSV